MREKIKLLKQQMYNLEEKSIVASKEGNTKEARRCKGEANKLGELIYTLCTGC